MRLTLALIVVFLVSTFASAQKTSDAIKSQIKTLHAEKQLYLTFDGRSSKIMGIADMYGTLEPGKVADIVLYDDDPFEHATHVMYTIVGGRVTYDRAEYLKLPFERRILPILSGGSGVGCCMGW